MEERIRSADEMLNIVRANPVRLNALKEDPLPELEKLRVEAVEKIKGYVEDKMVYRIAICVLGTLAILAAIGSIILALQDIKTPEVLVALGSAAVGALVGLFAPSPSVK
jgi:flagellar motor component MotA